MTDYPNLRKLADEWKGGERHYANAGETADLARALLVMLDKEDAQRRGPTHALVDADDRLAALEKEAGDE